MRERERERVVNYLELPNNPTTFSQENCDFLVLPICRYAGCIVSEACMSLSFSTYVLFKIRGQRYGMFLNWARKYKRNKELTYSYQLNESI